MSGHGQPQEIVGRVALLGGGRGVRDDAQYEVLLDFSHSCLLWGVCPCFAVMDSSLVINRLPLFVRRVIRLLTGAKLQHLNVKNEKIPFLLF